MFHVTSFYSQFSFVLILLLFACAQNGKDPYTGNNSQIKKSGLTAKDSTVLSIELEWHFDNTPIYLELDDDILVQDHLTTDYSISAAWLSGRLVLPVGGHAIKIRDVGAGLGDTYTFDLQDSLSILVQYDQLEKKFRFQEYAGFILRD